MCRWTPAKALQRVALDSRTVLSKSTESSAEVPGGVRHSDDRVQTVCRCSGMIGSSYAPRTLFVHSSGDRKGSATLHLDGAFGWRTQVETVSTIRVCVSPSRTLRRETSPSDLVDKHAAFMSAANSAEHLAVSNRLRPNLFLIFESTLLSAVVIIFQMFAKRLKIAACDSNQKNLKVAHIIRVREFGKFAEMSKI